MGVFNLQAKMVRLGAQSFQPLGSWPITSDSGSRGASGSAQPPVVPVNVSGYYSLRPSARQYSDQRGDFTMTPPNVLTGRKPSAN